MSFNGNISESDMERAMGEVNSLKKQIGESRIYCQNVMKERDELKIRLEQNRCNSGHDTLPLRLWDCPACTEIIRKERDRLKAALELAKGALNEIYARRDFTRLASCCVEKSCHINTDSNSCSFQTGVLYGNADRAATASQALVEIKALEEK